MSSIYLLTYTLTDVDDNTIDGTGEINRNTVGNPTPELRGSLGLDTSLTIGVVNATDEAPPFVAVSGSYDPPHRRPAGRRIYVKLGTTSDF